MSPYFVCYVCERLASTKGCRGRGLNRIPLSPIANTLPLSYPVTLFNGR